MMLLISKVQYRDFETGEFVEEKARSYAETIALIEAFPWEAERRDIVIDLTNPSVTIHGCKGDYLKLGPSFNGKFGLHYLKSKKELYHKVLVEVRDFYGYIKDYFDGVFDTADFQKVKTWPQDVSEHFIAKDFRYVVDARAIKRFLLETTLINILFVPIIIFLFFYDRPVTKSAVYFLLFFIVLLGGGVNFIGFFNYYLCTKNKVLIMSKKNGLFYYGNTSSPIAYHKADIVKATVLALSNSKHPLSEFAVVKVEFKNGLILKIPNLLIDQELLVRKLSGCDIQYKNAFPLL